MSSVPQSNLTMSSVPQSNLTMYPVPSPIWQCTPFPQSNLTMYSVPPVQSDDVLSSPVQSDDVLSPPVQSDDVLSPPVQSDDVLSLQSSADRVGAYTVCCSVCYYPWMQPAPSSVSMERGFEGYSHKQSQWLIAIQTSDQCCHTTTLQPQCCHIATLQSHCCHITTLQTQWRHIATLQPHCCHIATLQPQCCHTATLQPQCCHLATLEPQCCCWSIFHLDKCWHFLDVMAIHLLAKIVPILINGFTGIRRLFLYAETLNLRIECFAEHRWLISSAFTVRETAVSEWYGPAGSIDRTAQLGDRLLHFIYNCHVTRYI